MTAFPLLTSNESLLLTKYFIKVHCLRCITPWVLINAKHHLSTTTISGIIVSCPENSLYSRYSSHPLAHNPLPILANC
jgi:hypothetical protein